MPTATVRLAAPPGEAGLSVYTDLIAQQAVDAFVAKRDLAVAVGHAFEASERYVAQSAAMPVHAYDQTETLLGQGTLARELAYIEALRDLPVGVTLGGVELLLFFGSIVLFNVKLQELLDTITRHGEQRIAQVRRQAKAANAASA